MNEPLDISVLTDDDGASAAPASVILRMLVGSRAYGLATDDSDTDVRAVYVPGASVHWSLAGAPEQFEDDATQTVVWEIEKVVRLALKGNPAILEALWSPLVLFASDLGRGLLDIRRAFISRLVVRTFSGYAEDQFRALERIRERSREEAGSERVKWGHAMHLCRLLMAGEHLVRTGELVLDATPERERLLAIKRGEVRWDDVNAWRMELAERFARAAMTTGLPSEPDHGAAQRFLLAARREMARREGPTPRSNGVRVSGMERSSIRGVKLDLCQRIVDRHRFPLLFATISGAHLYGFPSADSDYDLRGVHCLPLRHLLSLDDPSETIESAGIEEGVEIDLVTHDAEKFFRLLLRRNGYVLEQLTSPLVVRTSAAHEELLSLVPGMLTRHHAHHYLGFAATQQALFLKESPPRVKPLLYIYRVLLTGIHLMRTGEIEANLVRLHEQWGRPLDLGFIPGLIEAKIHGAEKGALPETDVGFHVDRCAGLVQQLERDAAETSLPDAPSAREALNDLLLRIRGV